MNKYIFLFGFTLLLFQHTFACEKVLLKGKVVDSLNPHIYYDFMVVNRTKGVGFFGQPNGTFSLYVNENDSINISVKGYELIGFKVKPNEDCQHNFFQYLNRKATELMEVVVRPIKSLEQIKEERASLALRETRTVTGVNLLLSPITALYQAFSKTEKNKRWIAEQEFKDNQRKVVKELLRLYVSYDIIQLSEDQFDDFILFINVDVNFFKTATEFELVTFIKDKYSHYKLLNNVDTQLLTTLKNNYSRNNDSSAYAIFDLLNGMNAIDLPQSEYARFNRFLNLEDRTVRNAINDVFISSIQSKYKRYIEFYRIDIQQVKTNFNITEEENERWKWDLEHSKKKNAAAISLIRLYNEKKVIFIPEDEFEKFIRFAVLTNQNLKKMSSEELIQYTREKYFKYMDFYYK